MSYSVVVVEDEPDIANGLKKLVERLSPECKVVGVAHDGEEGMQKIQYFNADIVLTDIRMPGMDGIEMIKRLKSLGCNAQFVILTGYAEFSYARSAVRLGVCDYLTKPIEEDELSFILHKIGSSLEDSHRSMSHIESLEGKIEIYSKSIREYELKSFLESDETDQKLILSEIKRFGFPMDASYGCAMVEFAESESDLSSVLDLSQNYWLFPCQKNTTAVFVAFDSEPNWEGFWQSIHQTLKDKACIGLSEIHQSAAKLREAYLEARHALNYKVIRGSALISYSDVKQFRGVGVTVSPSNLKRLEECMDAMDNDELAIVINSIFKELSQMTDLSLTDLQLVSLDLILAGVRKIPCLRMQLNSFLGKNILSLDSIANFQTMDELSNWIISIL
ncbi:MAG: response regulator, partial [Clostridiales bacterium]|nr:response regulator [Clostridiales bacterium]